MTQYERMVKGLIYDPGDEEILREQFPYQDKLWEFNQLKPSDIAGKEKYMKEVFAECGENNYIELPLHANWGGHHVHFGSHIYANSNLNQLFPMLYSAFDTLQFLDLFHLLLYLMFYKLQQYLELLY